MSCTTSSGRLDPHHPQQAHNIKAPGESPGHFVQSPRGQDCTIDVSWNEIINEYNKSDPEDVIYLYQRAYAGKIHDNYIDGAYPTSVGSGFSGSGIMTGNIGAHDNEIYGNTIVSTTNEGIALEGGWNNSVHDNRMVSDGRDDAGDLFSAANVGLVVWNGTGDAGFGNNKAWNNSVAWINGSNQRNDWWIPDCTVSCSNASLSSAPTHTDELAEHQSWLSRVAASGITVGR